MQIISSEERLKLAREPGWPTRPVFAACVAGGGQTQETHWDTLGLGTLGTVRLGPACTAHVSPVSLQQGQSPPTINIFQR